MSELKELAANKPGVVDHFDKRSKEWDDLYEREEFKQRMGRFKNALSARVSEGAKVLDYGCGTGAISLSLAAKGYNVTGIDAAPGMVEQAQSKLKGNENLNLKFLTLPEKLAVEFPQAFDAIVCSSVIEYIENDLALLKDFYSMLKPGGFLIISVPNGSGLLTGLQRRLSRMIHAKDAKGSEDSAFRRREYRRGEFRGKLGQANFVYQASEYFAIPRMASLGRMLSNSPVSRYLGTLELVMAQANKS